METDQSSSLTNHNCRCDKSACMPNGVLSLSKFISKKEGALCVAGLLYLFVWLDLDSSIRQINTHFSSNDLSIMPKVFPISRSTKSSST
jgi:hypothetical protein